MPLPLSQDESSATVAGGIRTGCAALALAPCFAMLCTMIHQLVSPDAPRFLGSDDKGSSTGVYSSGASCTRPVSLPVWCTHMCTA